MNQLVFFLEEPSAREMLKNLLPRILPDKVTVRYVVFEGKQDLENQLGRKLRGWCVPDTRFVVMRDKDQADCLHGQVPSGPDLPGCWKAGRTGPSSLP